MNVEFSFRGIKLLFVAMHNSKISDPKHLMAQNRLLSKPCIPKHWNLRGTAVFREKMEVYFYLFVLFPKVLGTSAWILVVPGWAELRRAFPQYAMHTVHIIDVIGPFMYRVYMQARMHVFQKR